MQKNVQVALAGFIAVIALFLVYSNHFNNPFELDDSHTIVNNYAIREFTPAKYFSDSQTSSSLPRNQAYRPGVTTLNAADYAMWSKVPGENPQPKWFHVSIFIAFVLLCILLFFFYNKIFELTFPQGKYNQWLAFFAAAFFSFHTANAETINYIIARADSFSTLMVITAFLTYIYLPKYRKIQLFLIPMAIGFFVKEPTIMFAPLLFLFIYFFEENASLTFKEIFSKKFTKPLLVVLPAIILGITLIVFAKKMTPPTWSSGAESISTINYFLTNFFSVVHYLGNFIIPANLAADTDWLILENRFDDRILVGFAVIVALLALAVKCSAKKETRPIAFGILWFFVTLIPTSTIFPFSEPNNDHRTFFGYIGLVLAVVNGAGLLIYKFSDPKKRPAFLVPLLAGAGIVVLSCHAYGVVQRNKVWADSESLWQDAVKKCPNSGRIWMNLGLAQMQKGNLESALVNFKKTKELWPYYSYVYINLGILKNRLGQIQEAETDFLTGINYGDEIPDAYYYYGTFLMEKNRVGDAKRICNQGLEKSPYSADLLSLKSRIDAADVSVSNMLELVKKFPTADNYVNLSLAHYNAKDYKACINAANEAVKIKPDYGVAWNNICSAYNMLRDWDNAILAGQKAIQIDPQNQLFVANLKLALENQQKNKPN
ncbi:MAG: hypothetical protein IAF38_10195 [Bacteroidia bacterium]|nr:hypothetical protein [Bacteroidia bacterium]